MCNRLSLAVALLLAGGSLFTTRTQAQSATSVLLRHGARSMIDNLGQGSSQPRPIPMPPLHPSARPVGAAFPTSASTLHSTQRLSGNARLRLQRVRERTNRFAFHLGLVGAASGESEYLGEVPCNLRERLTNDDCEDDGYRSAQSSADWFVGPGLDAFAGVRLTRAESAMPVQVYLGYELVFSYGRGKLGDRFTHRHLATLKLASPRLFIDLSVGASLAHRAGDLRAALAFGGALGLYMGGRGAFLSLGFYFEPEGQDHGMTSALTIGYTLD